MAFFTHYLLRIYALTPLPSVMELWSSPLEKYRWRSAALEKLEVTKQCSGALRLTLTTEKDCYQLRTKESKLTSHY